MANDKKMLLIAIKGTRTQIVAEGVASYVGIKKKEFIKSGNWCGWTFQIRSILGYSNVKILFKDGKIKK